MASDRKNKPAVKTGQKSVESEKSASRAASIDDKRFASAKKYADMQERILKIEENIAKVSKLNLSTGEQQERRSKLLSEYAQKRLDLLEESKDIEQEIEDSLDNQEKVEKSLFELVRKKRENQIEIKDLTQDVLKSLREQKIETEDLDDVGKAVTQNMRATANFGQDFSNIVQVVNSKLADGVNFSDEFMDTIQDTNKIRLEYRDLEQEIAENSKLASQGKYDSNKVEEDLAKKMRKLRMDEEGFEDKAKEFMKNRQKMSKEQQAAKMHELKIEQQALTTRRKVLDAIDSQNKILGETSKTSEKTLGVMEKITSGDFKGALLQKFGLDDINKQLKEKVGGALVNVVNQVKSGNLKGAFSAAGDGLKNLTKLAGAFTMALGIGAIFKLGTFLLDTFMKADAEVAELGKNFGISKNEAKELHHTAVDVANEMGVVGIHSEQIAKGLQNVSANLGNIDLTGTFSSGNAAVQQMVKDTTLMTEKFGLSAEEAGNISNIAAIAGKSVGEMSMMSSKLGNGIFTAKESMKILAGIPKSIVSSMSKMPEAMIKTAMNAKMLGLNMKQIADIGRKSLDIEQSLEAEMEARVLLGREINLDKMRAAALDGDQETVMNELLKTAGSMQDFNKMNVIQKEALAKAAGMEVDQLAEMLGKQEELNKAGLTQAKVQELQAMNEQDLAKEIANTSDKNKKAYLEKLAAEKKSESTQAAMASLMQRLQELAVKLVTPLMDMVDAFMNGKEGADVMNGIVGGIGGLIKAIVPYIKLVASVIGSILGPLSSIMGMFAETEDKTKAVSDGVGKVAGAIKPVEAGFGGILKVVGAIGAFFIGKSLLSKGFDILKDKAADVGKTIMSKVGGALKDVAGKATGKLGDKIKESVSSKLTSKGKDLVADKGMDLASKAPLPGGPPKKAGGFTDFFEKMDPKKMLAGAAALLIVAAALYVAAKAMQEFSTGVKWEGVLMGIVTLGALVLAVMGLGAIMSSGVGAVAILAGAAALLILSSALFVMGKAMQEFSKAAVIMLPVFESLFKMDPAKLLGVAAGITALGASIAAFGVLVGGGGLVGGIMSGIGKLFGGESPIEQIMEISKKLDGSKLMTTAQAIRELANAFKYFTEETAKLKDFDTAKLDDIIERMDKVQKAQQGNALAGAVTGVANSISSFVGNIFGSPEKQTTQPVTAGGGSVAVASGGGGTNMANVEKKLDTLISVISQAANQPLVIKFGEKTIEEIKTQLNFKKATNIGVDKGYGKTVT